MTETLRPPEVRAELTRVNAEDLSSSSSDEERTSRREAIIKQNAKKLSRFKKGLPPSGKVFSRSASGDVLGRESQQLIETKQDTASGSRTTNKNVKGLPPIYKTTVRCLM